MFFRFAIFALVVVVVAASVTELRTKPHPMDGKRKAVRADLVIDGFNFTFGLDNIMNWYDAEAACDQLGMRMLELDYMAKDNRAIQWMQQNPDYDMWSWIGLRREAGITDFSWSSGIGLDHTGWGPGQPSNSLTYPTCADIAGFFGAWDDDNCGVFALSYICEDIPRP